MTNNYMQIKNKTEDQAEIYFYGDIVSSSWEKWTDTDTAPEDVRSLLEQVSNVKQLNIYINSGGGSVFAGLAIYNMLKRHSASKTVYVDGLAASIASIIAMAGDKIVIPSNAFLMIHKPWNWTVGNANDFRKTADDLDRIEEGILNVYADNLAEGVDIVTIREMVEAETWLNGLEASKYFNVEVVESNKAVAFLGSSIANYKNVPDALLAKDEPKDEVDENEIIKLQVQLELL